MHWSVKIASLSLLFLIACCSLVKCNTLTIENEPCDDMYRYSCKNALESRWDAAGNLYEKQVTELLESDTSTRLIDGRPRLQQLRKLYKSCKNEDRRNQLANRPLNELIERIGNFPIWNAMSPQPVSSEDDFIETLLKFKMNGIDINGLFSVNLKKHPGNHLLGFELTYPDVKLLRYPSNSLASHFVPILYQLGFEVGQIDTIRSELDGVAKFVDRLREICSSKSKEVAGDYPYNTMSLGELEMLVDSVAWNKFLTNLVDTSLDRDATKLVIPKTFDLDSLNTLLKNTKSETIKNYLFLNMIEQAATKLSSTLASLVKEAPLTCPEFVGQYLGPVLIGELVSCLNSVDTDLNLTKTRALVVDIFENVRGEVVNLGKIQNQQADDDATRDLRSVILEKGENLRLIAGYQDEHLDESLMDSLYGKLNLDESSFFENWLKIRRLNSDNQFILRFNKEADQFTFMTFLGNPSFVGAMYQPELNAIHLSLGLLTTKQFVDSEQNEAINYGLVGSVLGHEMSHSLDRNSITFDKSGDWQERNRAIMGQSSLYKSTFECIMNQYDGRSVAGTSVKLNGALTINENFCDIMGYQLAFRALKTRSAELNAEFDEKLYWISAARVWCDDPSLSPWNIADQSKGDTHSPNEFRVNLALPNSDQFQQAFECPKTSKMNPELKCGMFWA